MAKKAMKTYAVRRRETYSATYLVDAEDEATACKMVENGEAGEATSSECVDWSDATASPAPG